MQLTAGPMVDTNAECKPFLRHKHVGSGLAAGRSNLNQNGKEKLDVPHHERSEAAACIGSYQRAVENICIGIRENILRQWKVNAPYRPYHLTMEWYNSLKPCHVWVIRKFVANCSPTSCCAGGGLLTLSAVSLCLMSHDRSPQGPWQCSHTQHN